MNFEKLLENEVFTKLDQNSINAFKKLEADLKNKNTVEAIPDIMNFVKSVPALKNLEEAEKAKMKAAVISVMTPDEQKKFNKIQQLLNF